MGGMATLGGKGGNTITIHRDAAGFEHILAFFGSGDAGALPKEPALRAAILRDARYYNANALVHVLSGQIERQATIGAHNEQMAVEENRYRQLFAQHRSHADLGDADSTLTLISVFKHMDRFDFRVHAEEAADLGFAIILRKEEPPASGPSVCTQKEFLQQFYGLLTEKAYSDYGKVKHPKRTILGEKFDWSNVMVAGGSVMRCLVDGGKVEKYVYRNMNRFLSAELYTQSDFDMFVYGLTPEQANEKLACINQHLCENYGSASINYVRTKGSATFTVGRKISLQVILRLYKSRAEVLMAFDLDSCAVGFDGKHVWALPRAVRSFNGRYNLVDETRPNFQYEARLYKYCQRGFAIGVPGLRPDRSNLDALTFVTDVSELPGLGKLLRAEVITCSHAAPAKYPDLVDAADDDHVMALRNMSCTDCGNNRDKCVETSFYAKGSAVGGATSNGAAYSSRNRKHPAMNEAAVELILGRANAWYDSWRIGIGTEGFNDLIKTVFEFGLRHDALRAAENTRGPKVVDLTRSSSDEDGLPVVFRAPVLLSNTFDGMMKVDNTQPLGVSVADIALFDAGWKYKVGGVKQPLDERQCFRYQTNVSSAVDWHVADPTRRYIGGFTAEGVDFYGSTLVDPAGGASAPAQQPTVSTEVVHLRAQLALAQKELATLRPAAISLLDDGSDSDGGSAAAAVAVAAVAAADAGACSSSAPSALAQLHETQQKISKVKEERDDAVEEQQDEGQYSALFIDKQQQQIDALKALCSSRGIDQHDVDIAVKKAE